MALFKSNSTFARKESVVDRGTPDDVDAGGQTINAAQLEV